MIPFHGPEGVPTVERSEHPLEVPWIAFMIETHKAFGLLKNLHLHLNNIGLLKEDKLPTPKPPSSLFAKTWDQLTKCIFLSSIDNHIYVDRQQI